MVVWPVVSPACLQQSTKGVANFSLFALHTAVIVEVSLCLLGLYLLPFACKKQGTWGG